MGNYRWYVLALTLVNQAMTVGILIYCFALYVVPWLGDFNVNRGTVMLAIFMLQIGTGFLSPLAGRLLDTDWLRLLVLLGVLVLAGGLLLLSLASAFWQVMAIYCTAMPLAMALCGSLSSQTMIGKWFKAGRSLAIGVSAMGTSIGGFLMPPLVAELIALWDWQFSLVILAAATLALMVPLNFAILKARPPAQADGMEDGHPDSRIWSNREILTSRSFWIPVQGFVPVNAAFSGIQFNIGAYVSDLGFSPALAAQVIAVTSVTMIGGKLVFGSLGDRVDHRWLYWLMAAFMFAALLLYQSATGRQELFLAAILQGFATGGIMPMIGIVYVTRFGAASFGKVLGLVSLFLMAGGFGSILSGYIYDWTQSYDLAFWLFALLLIPCSVAMAWLPVSRAPRVAGLAATG